MALLLFWSGVALGAGSAERISVPLTRVYAQHTCADPATMPGIQLAATPAQADHLWTLCRGRLVLGDAAERPPLDFDRERLIYLHMGARRTGGFHLDLANESASLVDKTLVIPVAWQEPGQGTIVTQMMTHPCLMVAVPRGSYERIEVVDEQGTVRLTETLPAETP